MRSRKARPTRQPRTRRDRVLGWSFTAGLHLAVLAALVWPRTAPPPAKPESSPQLTIISLAQLPKPPGPPEPETESPEQAPPPVARPSPMPILVKVTSPEPPDNSDILSEAQLAGASSAGEGAGGGGGSGCDTARLVQQALRKDPMVHMAVMKADRQGKAILMWNGDWVRSGAQDGKGLSAVRQAIMWEVAFSPEACRNAPMQGTVLLSLADGGTRFAIGAGTWRWSDLLGVPRKG